MMPLRRVSAAGPPAAYASPTGRSRTAPTAVGSDGHDGASISDSTVIDRLDLNQGEAKVVNALVGRLLNRLPCNAGTRLAFVEAEPSVRSTISALLQLSKTRLPLVFLALGNALDTLAKYATTSSLLTTSLDVVQSQLFVLHVLQLCLTASWQHQALSNPTTPVSGELRRCWPDPTPLDEALVKPFMVVLFWYIRMVSADPHPAPGTSSPAPVRDRGFGTTSTTSSRASHGASRATSTAFDLAFLQTVSSPPHVEQPVKPIAQDCTTPAAAVTAMTRTIARVVFLVSARNWSIIQTRLKQRFKRLTTSNEEDPDLLDLRLLEWACLDRVRLSQVLQEISGTFLQLKKPSQLAVATSLHLAVWNFIDTFPAEYNALVEADKKIDGGADYLFDVLFSQSDLSSNSAMRRNKAFYPLMATLLVLCPDTLKRAVLDMDLPKSGSGFTKKINWLESLRKGLGGARSVDTCASAYCDLVNAAMALLPRLDTSGARSLVLEIQADLKNALFFNPASSDVVDDDTLVDGLVALYKADSQTVISAVFPKLFKSGDESEKQVAVRACLALVQEDGRYPWLPSAAQLGPAVSSSLRAVLKSQATLLLGDFGNARRPGRAGTLPSSQEELVLDLLRLFALEPNMLLSGNETQDAASLSTISSLMVGPSPNAVRFAAGRTAVAILQYVGQQSSTLGAFPSAIPWQFLVDAGRQELFAFQAGDPDDLSDAADTFKAVLLELHSMTRTAPQILHGSTHSEAALHVAVTTVLTSLASTDVEKTTSMTPALVALGELIRLKNDLPRETPVATLADPSSASRPVIDQLAVLEALASLPPAQGRQQQQRQFRRVLRQYAKPSTHFWAAWVGFSARAKSLAGFVDRNEEPWDKVKRRSMSFDGRLDDDQRKEWQNLCALLAACSACTIYDQDSQPLALCEIVGKNLLPRVYDESIELANSSERYASEVAALLLSSTVSVRETAKDVLGQELPLSLCRSAVTAMNRFLSKAITPNGILVDETYTALVDQILSVVKLSADRMVPSQAPAGLQVDMGDLMMSVARYLGRLGRSNPELRMKTRFCTLLESLLSKSSYVTFSNDLRFRNLAFDLMTEWSSENLRDADGFSLAEATSKLHVDLDLAGLKAMALLSEGLVLASGADESIASQPIVKSRLFHKHYQHLVRLLERTSIEGDSVVPPTPSFSGVTIARPTISATSQAGLAIEILSNLLSANIDVGLKQCLVLGYHEDSALRTAFMQLISNILQRGAGFGRLATKRTSSAPRAYTEALTSSNLALAVAIIEACSASEIDEMSGLLFRTFEARGTLLPLLRLLIEREVQITHHESELFRANSLTTRLLTSVARTYGYNLIRVTLQPLIQSLVDKPANCSFELDPSKALPSEDIDRNAHDLRLLCQALLDLICTSVPRIPVVYRAICHYIWEAVNEKFPGSTHSAVGSFFFLRFFCPCIVAPESIDIDLPPEKPEVRRALILVTKVIQNLANNVVFREPHMQVLNSFLSENIRTVTKFLSDIACKAKSWELSAAVKLSQEQAEWTADVDGDEVIIHRFIFRHQDKIESSLAAMPFHFRGSSSIVLPRTARPDLEPKEALRSLKVLMKATGPPADSPRLTSGAQTHAYDEFMHHNQSRSTESVASAFYEGPANQNGVRIFYFVVARLALIDYDLLGYHIFSLLDRVTDYFDIVIDLTDFSAANELPVAWMKRCLQICPPSILSCVSTIAVYNPNTYAKRRVRRLVTELLTASSPVGKTIVAASSPAELAEFIPFTSLALPDLTMALAYEADRVFTNVLSLIDHEMQVPVVVKLGHDCLQVASRLKADVTTTLKSYIIDLIRLRDIDDIVTEGVPSDHLVVKHSQTESVTFITRKRGDMAQILRAARARLRDVPSDARSLSPNDVPGTLLNVALLNLSAENEVLRMGAYSLIHELSQYFKYDTAFSLVKVSAGLTIPQNSLAFTYQLSRSLALSLPHLTLEFFKEWTIGFTKAHTVQKTACLHYLAPWLANLEHFAKPGRDDNVDTTKSIAEIVRALVDITVAERRGLYLAIQASIWAPLASSHDTLIDIVLSELLHAAIDAGVGSEKAETVGDILVSIASTAIRGKLVARLRKTLAQTYLKPSASLETNVAWNEVCTLARLNLNLSFCPETPLDAQLFLPELCHVMTLLVGSGSLLLRQTVYGMFVNTLQTLAIATPSGDMDGPALYHLLQRSQTDETMAVFGLSQQGAGELAELPLAADGPIFLDGVETLARFLGEVMTAAAVSTDCCNAWRARWMGLVAATCFQHNPATQPQAFTVLGYLASEELDDDLVYQILVAMSTTLGHFSDIDHVLVIAMLRCLSRIIPGLMPDSRYVSSLFWLAVGHLELGYVPLFAAALELMLTTLQVTAAAHGSAAGLLPALLESRKSFAATEAALKLDQVAGVSFETNSSFALVGIIAKGTRHPSTKKRATEALMELLRLLTVHSVAEEEDPDKQALISSNAVPFFIALLPLYVGSPSDLKGLFEAAGLEVSDRVLNDAGNLQVFDLLSIPDNSTALLLITLVVTLLHNCGSDVERLVLYRLLAEASVEMPEVLSMTYDTLVPRMLSTLSTTPNTQILGVITLILERAMSDPSFQFPSALSSESQSSLQMRGYSASISSEPSAPGLGAREAVLDDLGMKGLGDMSFAQVKPDRLALMARWIAALIESFTI